jgi:FMN phosphatase YigB (HAD superfamily)/DNA-binding XRE family transcriptional regulator
MDEKGLGMRLQHARKAAGMTQQALCQRASLSYSTLAKIERGAIKSPSIFTIQSIARALHVTLDTLLGGTGNGGAKSKSGISFVYFDVNGTLVRFYQGAYAQLAQETGAQLDVIETAFWHYNDRVCRGTMTMAEFNSRLAKRLNVDAVDWTAQYMAAVQAIEPMRKFAEWVAARYEIGLLTNIMPGLVHAMQQKHILPSLDFNAIIDSSEVGLLKPEPAMYELATTRANHQPGEILLIDDTRANLAAAEQAGWHVLWFDGYQPEESIAKIQHALQPA